MPTFRPMEPSNPLKKEFVADLALSVGQACRAAKQLSLNGLRRVSSPLDWMMSYKIDVVAKLYSTAFEDFFSERIVLEKDDELNFHIVQDTITKMISKHHFPEEKSVDEYYPEFINKMRARFQNVDRLIKQSDVVLFVANRNDSIEEIQNFLHEMHALYKKKFILINIRDQKQSEVSFYRFKNTLLIADYAYDDEHEGNHKDMWRGNDDIWKIVLHQVKLTEKHKFQKRPDEFV